jgi:hypothetical protein
MEQDPKETDLTQEEDVDGALPPQDNNKARGCLVKAVNNPDNRVTLPIKAPCGVVRQEEGEVDV